MFCILFFYRYHDMPNVVDFFVLKDDYEEAKARNWKPGKDVYFFNHHSLVSIHVCAHPMKLIVCSICY